MLGKICAMNDEGCCSACKLLLSFQHNNLSLFLHSSTFLISPHLLMEVEQMIKIFL